MPVPSQENERVSDIDFDSVSLISRWILKLFWWCSIFTIGSLATMLATTLCQFQIKSGHHLIRTSDGPRWQLVYMGHKQSNIITMKFENYMIYYWKIAELVLKIITQSLAITNDSTTRLSTKLLKENQLSRTVSVFCSSEVLSFYFLALCCMSFFDLQLLITPLVSFGHCVVCLSLIYSFWLPLWYLQTFLD